MLGKKKETVLVDLENLTAQLNRDIIVPARDSLLSSVQASLGGFADPISILPDRSVPLNEATVVMAHNAFNSRSSGAYMPNQELSLTRLLDIGARGLEFDVHYESGKLRLCHAMCSPGGWVFGYNRELSDALLEVNDWLKNHMDQTIILKFEDELRAAPRGALAGEIYNVFNRTSVFTPQDFDSFGSRWPSLEQINQLGRQLIVMPQYQHQGAEPSFFRGNWGGRFKNNYNIGTIAAVRSNNFIVPRTMDQLLEVGEDGTFIGTVLDQARRTPLVGEYVPEVAGQMTKKDVQALKRSGINMISLDHLKENDSRLTSTVTLYDVHNSMEARFFFIPAALVAAAYTADTREGPSMSTRNRILTQLLIASTFPEDARLLYRAVDTGISAFNDSIGMVERTGRVASTLGKVRALGNAVVNVAAQGVVAVKKAEVATPIALEVSKRAAESIPDIVQSVPVLPYCTSALSGIYTFASTLTATKLIFDPLTSTVGAFYDSVTDRSALAPGQSRLGKVYDAVERGFVRGVDLSTFGLTNFYELLYRPQPPLLRTPAPLLSPEAYAIDIPQESHERQEQPRSSSSRPSSASSHVEREQLRQQQRDLSSATIHV